MIELFMMNILGTLPSFWKIVSLRETATDNIWHKLGQSSSPKQKETLYYGKVNVMHDQMLIPVIHKHNILHC